jgi:hypothetical protein
MAFVDFNLRFKAIILRLKFESLYDQIKNFLIIKSLNFDLLWFN